MPQQALPSPSVAPPSYPLKNQAMFWRAHHLGETGFVWHIPFLFWLIDVMRPRSFVEIGVVDGISYFSACQAVAKLNIKTRCFGVFLEKSGIEFPDNLNRITSKNCELYSEFSEIHVDSERGALRAIPTDEIDVLLFNQALCDNFFLEINEVLADKLSDRAVLVFHGTKTQFLDNNAKAFLANLESKYPSIITEHGDGLIAILWGKHQHPNVKALAEDGIATGLCEAFARLGAAHHFEWIGRRDGENARVLQSKLVAVEKSNSTLNKTLRERDAAYDDRSRLIAILQAKNYDFQNLILAKTAELSEISELLSAEQERSRQEKINTDLIISDLRKQMDDRFNEISLLIRELEAGKEKDAHIGRLGRKINQLKEECKTLSARNGRIKRSVSWRLTAPIRALGRLISKT